MCIFRGSCGRRLGVLNFCVGIVGGSVEQQVHGALDNMEARLALVGLTL